MSNFGLTDIKFISDKVTTIGSKGSADGPLAKLYSGSDGSDMLKYPLDIGSTGRGHYVVFYANVFFKTQYTNIQTTAGLTQAQANLDRLSAKRGVGMTGGVLADALEKNAGAVGAVAGGIASKVLGPNAGQKTEAAATEFTRDAADFARKLQSSANKYKRTNQTIVLYMPGTGINMDYQHQYNEVSATEAFGMLGLAAQGGGSLVDQMKGGADKSIKNLSPFLAEGLATKLPGTGNGAGQILFQATGYAVNPQVELLYSAPMLREPQFSFDFYPTSRQEAKEIFNIIKRFKFHAAPEIATGVSGRYFIPPSSFDIRFMYNGKENENISKISTCVLKTVQVNYTPDGGAWSAYESDVGSDDGIGDGFPKHINLVLAFQEMEIITKELIDMETDSPGGF